MHSGVVRKGRWAIQSTLARLRARLRSPVITAGRRTRVLDLAQLEDRLLLSAAPPGGEPLAAAAENSAGASVTLQVSNDPATTAGESTATSVVDAVAAIEHNSLTPADVGTVGDAHDAPSSTGPFPRHELMFVNADVENSDVLLAELLNSPNDLVHLEVFYLENGRDGITQINEVLAGYADIDAVHFVSHGTVGAVKLGDTWLATANVATFADVIRDWSGALAGDADLLFYGCDVAGGAPGHTLLKAVSDLTGADVAASADDTGHVSLGGNWDLEFSVGAIDTSVPFDSAARASWLEVLAVPTGPTTPVNTPSPDVQTTGPANSQSVATDEAGNFVVVWTGDTAAVTGIFAQRFDAGGNPIGTQFSVNTTIAGRQYDPAVAMDHLGNFVITWVSMGQDADAANEGNIYARLYDAAGTPLGDEFLVNTTTPLGDQQAPSVAYDDFYHNFVITWASFGQDGDGWGIYAQKFDSAGAALTAEFQVNSTTTSDQIAPQVSGDDFGDFYFVWSSFGQDGSSWGVYGQYYSFNDTFTGPERTINTTTSGSQSAPAVSFDSSGNWLVVWEGQGSGGGASIYANWFKYDAAGGNASGEFLASTVTAGNQSSPSVSRNADRDFVVTWMSNGQDGDGVAETNIHAQLIEGRANGVSLFGPEFLVNGFTLGDQEFPSVAMSDAGGFVIAWSGNGLGDPNGVFVQQFADSFGSGSPTVSLANSTLDYTENGTPVAIDGGLTITASSNPSLFGATVSIVFGFEAGADVLTFVDQFGITGSFDAANGVLTLTGTASMADYEAALRSVTYHNSSENPDDNARVVEVVIDDGTSTSSDSRALRVTPTNDAPLLAAPASATTPKDTPLFFSAASGNAISVSDVDADGESVELTINAVNGVLTLATTIGLTFSQGDGANDPTMTFAGTLDAINAALDGLRFKPVLNFVGSASLGLYVDDLGNSGSGGARFASALVNITVTPANSAPNAESDSYSVDEDPTWPGLAVSAADGVLANDVDIDADPLTAVLVSGPSNGTLQLNADGSFEYQPDANFHGTDSFRYTANDGTVNSNITVVTIQVRSVNDVPVATDVSFVVDEDGSLVLPAPGALAGASDADADPLTALLVAGPANGSLNLNADGSFTYTPNANFSGSDSFTIRASDGLAVSNIATVAITVNAVDDAPVAAADSFAVAEDGMLAIAASGVLGNDGDADGDPLSAVLVSGPANGALLLNPDGSFTYTPNANFNGTDSFRYRAVAGSANSNVAVVTIAVAAANDVPQATAESYSTNEDTKLKVAAAGVLANDADADGDALEAVLVSGPADGSLALNSDGSFDYLPRPNFNGTDSFTYWASDGADGSNVVTVTITIHPMNDAPVARNDEFVMDGGDAMAVAAAGVLANDSDVDGEPLTTTLVNGPANGVVIVNADGSFMYTPHRRFAGTDHFTYKAFDGTAADVATVTLIVRLPAPGPGTGGTDDPPSPPGDPSPPVVESEPTVIEPPASPPSNTGRATLPGATGTSGSGFTPTPRGTQTRPNSEDAGVPPQARATNDRLQLIATHDLSDFLNERTRRDDRSGRSAESTIAANRFAFDPNFIVNASAMWEELQTLTAAMKSHAGVGGVAIGSAVTSALGLSVGYLFWILRSGYLLSSLLASLPAWRLIDPLPILDSLGKRDGDEDDDDESLESLVATAEVNAPADAGPPDSSTPQTSSIGASESL